MAPSSSWPGGKQAACLRISTTTYVRTDKADQNQCRPSDTTAATLTCLFYNLATHPEVYKTLQREVDTFFAGEEAGPDTGSLGKLEYLQACIDESLRLFPPVASGLQRQTPPQGIHAAGRFIPGNTIVMTPTYALCRGAFPSRCLSHF